jgi:type II secretory pathway component GspD/PulD (secretin)
MRYQYVLSGALGLFLSLLLFTCAMAADAGRVSNVFVDTDLRQALQDISAQAGVNIISDASVQGTVSVTLQNVSVDKALELILAGTPYMVKKNTDYYLVYSPDENSDTFSNVSQTRVIQVKYLPADQAEKLLPPMLQRYVRVNKDAATLVVTAPPQLMVRIVDDIGKIDKPTSDDTTIIPLQFLTAQSAMALLPTNLQHYVRADVARNVLAISAPPDVHNEILRQVREVDRPRPPGSFDLPDSHPVRVVKLNNANAKTTVALLPKSLQQYVQADEDTNSLAISAPEVLVREIQSDIGAIDTPRKHIMLDARVVALETSDLLNFGGQWSMPTLSAGTIVGDAVKWPWALEIGYSPDRQFTDALSLTLNLLSQNNEASIIASPQVLAEDGKEAQIQVTTEEYFPISATNGAYIETNLEKIQTGTILKITPQIGADGDITLNMNIEVSDVIARGQQNLPVVSRRTAQSTVQIQNGGTAAVAGLVDTRSQAGDAGVPGFADTPLLGRAFRTKTLDQKTRQVAVFITATVVDGRDEKFKNGEAYRPALPPVNKEAYRDKLRAALAELKVGSVQ